LLLNFHGQLKLGEEITSRKLREGKIVRKIESKNDDFIYCNNQPMNIGIAHPHVLAFLSARLIGKTNQLIEVEG